MTGKPPWLKTRIPEPRARNRMARLLREHGLHTICESGACPNLGECWGAGTATFMILGEVCTRSCGFCNVLTGRPGPVDPLEPVRLARAVRALGLSHVVITSVDRDDLPDGGAGLFAQTIRVVRELCASTSIEVLIPDFKGGQREIGLVVEAGPDVLAHNVETVPRLHRRVRPQARYERSLAVLEQAKRADPELYTKSSLMLGLGETLDEVVAVLEDLRAVGCDFVTLGQYLRPSLRHLPVERYVPPEVFAELAGVACRLGFRHVAAGPLVRGSYRAEEAVRQAAEQDGRPLPRRARAAAGG